RAESVIEELLQLMTRAKVLEILPTLKSKRTIPPTRHDVGQLNGIILFSPLTSGRFSKLTGYLDREESNEGATTPESGKIMRIKLIIKRKKLLKLVRQSNYSNKSVINMYRSENKCLQLEHNYSSFIRLVYLRHRSQPQQP